MRAHKCDKMLDAGARRCNEPATLFYQSEVIRQVAARCGAHTVIPYKPELGRLLHLTQEEYERELAKLSAVIAPVEILKEAAKLIARTGFSAHACATDVDGRRMSDVSVESARFCVSGAARAVAFHGQDGDGTSQERAYLSAMSAFCRFVGTETVMEWADAPGRSTEDAVLALQGAASELRKQKTIRWK